MKVAEGYARNYLVPKGLAYRHTDGIGKQVAHESRTRTARDNKDRQAAEQLAQRLKAWAIRFVRKAGETGSLFAGDRRRHCRGAGGQGESRLTNGTFALMNPSNGLGTFRIPVHLYRQLTAEMVVEVEAEEAGSGS